MSIPTAQNDAFNEHPARETLVCLGCGGSKPIGPIVCWTCFKRRPDGRSLKYWLAFDREGALIGMDENLRPVFDAANETWKRRTRRAWHEFFIDGCAFQADWLGAIQPELTRAYLLALAELHSNNGAEYERARKMVDVARRELLEAFESGPERPKQ